MTNHPSTHLPNLLLIGGATRNVGKTTLTKRIVSHFAPNNQIIGLKIKTLRDGDEKYHGKGRHELKGNYLVSEESYVNSEDTGTIFQAGAKRAFHIKTKHTALHEAFHSFLTQIDLENDLIVCESNSIREVITPGVFLMIMNKDTPQELKPSARTFKSLANRIIWTDGLQHNFNPKDLLVDKSEWKLRT